MTTKIVLGSSWVCNQRLFWGANDDELDVVVAGAQIESNGDGQAEDGVNMELRSGQFAKIPLCISFIEKGLVSCFQHLQGVTIINSFVANESWVGRRGRYGKSWVGN